MGKRFGKIKNGKLILASQIVNRDGQLLINDEQLYLEKGYKEIVYTDSPDNKDGFNLVSKWDEQEKRIVQNWTYEMIPDDYSGELLVAIRLFDSSNKELRKEVRRNYLLNQKYIENLIEKKKLLKVIYSHKKEEVDAKQLLHILNECKLDLSRFFEELNITEVIEQMNFLITEGGLFYKTEDLQDFNIYELMDTETHNLNKEQKKTLANNLIMPQYFKSNLSNLCALETYDTQSNRTMYNMAFIYLFTLFDEILLKIIRLICMHEKKWLISNGNMTSSEILECKTIDELHMMLVEKKINELSWGSYTDKLKFLLSKGIIIDAENKKLFEETILYLSIKRNLLVHNEGIWSQVTKEALKSTEYYNNISVGDAVDRSLESFEEASISIERAIKYLYKQICDKFDLLFQFNFDGQDERKLIL